MTEEMKEINEKEFVENIKKIMEDYENSRKMEIEYIEASEKLFEYVYNTFYPEGVY